MQLYSDDPKIHVSLDYRRPHQELCANNNAVYERYVRMDKQGHCIAF